jgi:serine/threonine-protein kinase PpkA
MEVPGFKIKQTIGHGGMAIVYLAVQESLSRDVVLKIMSTSHSEGSTFVERFMNEGRIIAGLQHPHIITIFDIGTAEDRVWISMEYVNGGDLKNRIDLRMTPLEALELVMNIGSALDFAHQRGIVHRDVKPQNILFRRDGTALLSDFGIAKEEETDTELTSTGTILGSPFYMSPEQAEGMLVDGRTDIYSLGIMFYEMLTGERPYPGDTAIKVIMQHIQSPVPELPPGLERFQPLLNGMMCKKRDDRIPTAAALVEQVTALYDAIRREQDPSITSEHEVEELRAAQQKLATEKRRWRLLILGSCVVLLLVGFAGLQIYAESLQSSGLVNQQRHETVSTEPLVAQASAAAAGINAAPATETVPGMSQQDVVRALEWLAKNSLQANRLTQPPADNAYYYFSRLLALDPGNETARKGFSDIAENYVVLAEREFSRRRYGKAQAYIALGLQVAPDNKSLLDLQSFIDQHKESIIDKIYGFFRGDD